MYLHVITIYRTAKFAAYTVPCQMSSLSQEMSLWGQQERGRRCILFKKKKLLGGNFAPLVWQDRWREARKGGERERDQITCSKNWPDPPPPTAAKDTRRWTFESFSFLPVSSQSLGSDPSIPPLVINPVPGFKRGASWTSTESLLLYVGVEARQDQNAALCIGFGSGVTQGSLLLQWHNVLHQACDGCVNVGVILENEDGDEALVGDDGGKAMHTQHYTCLQAFTG